MEVILNIGLDSKNGNIGIGTVLREIEASGFKLLEHTTLRSDTEQTVVARVDDRDMPGLDNRLYFVSLRLHQDCIAAYVPSEDSGDLYGPSADAWGEFNPVYFFQIDGTRLGRGNLAQAA